MGSSILVVISALAGYFVTRDIATPLKGLTMAAERITGGNLSSPLQVGKRGGIDQTRIGTAQSCHTWFRQRHQNCSMSKITLFRTSRHTGAGPRRVDEPRMG